MRGTARTIGGTCLALGLLQPAHAFVVAPPSVSARSGWLNSLDVQQRLGSARPHSTGSNRVGCSSNFRRRKRHVRGREMGQRSADWHGLEGYQRILGIVVHVYGLHPPSSLRCLQPGAKSGRPGTACQLVYRAENTHTHISCRPRSKAEEHACICAHVTCPIWSTFATFLFRSPASGCWFWTACCQRVTKHQAVPATAVVQAPQCSGSSGVVHCEQLS